MVRDPEAPEAGALGVEGDREDVLELEPELRLDLNSEIHAPTLAAPPAQRSAGVSSSAVGRDIMCLPVTVRGAGLKAAEVGIPNFRARPSPHAHAVTADS